MASSASARDGEMAHHKGHHQWSQASLQAQASAVVTQDMVRITLASELTGTSQTAVAQDLNNLLDRVMKDAKKSSKVKASSGNYRIWTVTDKKGKNYTGTGRGES